MALHRRRLLAAAGSAGAGVVGVGYWQRRRLRRFPSIRELKAVSGIAVPRIEEDPIITQALLEASYERTVDRFDEIEARLEPPYDRYTEEFIETLRTRLIDSAPETVTVRSRGVPAMHYARRQTLFTYRRIRSRVVEILAHESPGELPTETFTERASALDDRIDDVSVPYRGVNLGEAIVAGSTIESTIDSAENRVEKARDETERRVRWRELERATAAVEDAESFAVAKTGTDHRAEFPEIADRLVAEYERRREAAPDPHAAPDFEEATSTFASRGIGLLRRPMGQLGASPWSASRLPEEDAGRAAHTHALLLSTVPLYEAFSDVPNPVWWEEIDYELGAGPDDLREEKRATIDAAGLYLDRDDPLVRHLAAVPLGLVRATDSRVDSLVEDANTLEDAEWTTQLDYAMLLYRSARRYAEEIGDAVAVVDDT